MNNERSTQVGVSPEKLAQFQKQVRITIGVFVTLLVLLAVTVVASYLNLGRLGIIVALVISTIQALLSAMAFMHLRDERGVIFWVLLFTGVFASALMILIAGSYANAVTPSHVP